MIHNKMAFLARSSFPSTRKERLGKQKQLLAITASQEELAAFRLSNAAFTALL
jgi:hypothetical protein